MTKEKKKDKVSSFVALDFETLEGYRASVCQVGAVLYENGEIVDVFDSLVCPPTKNENWYCVQTHGLTYNDVKDAPTFPEVWKKIDEMIGDRPIVAHNAPFERSCINECANEFGTKSDYEFIDTLKLSREKFKGKRKHTLDEMCNQYKIRLARHHNALSDAIACGELYKKLTELD